MESIARACEGLVLISETDSPVEPIVLPRMSDLSPAALLEALGRDPDEAIETVDAAGFFDRLTQIREWHGEAEKELSARFARLRGVLEHELEDLRSFRVGRVRIDVFLLGRARGGTIAGVRSTVVET